MVRLRLLSLLALQRAATLEPRYTLSFNPKAPTPEVANIVATKFQQTLLQHGAFRLASGTSAGEATNAPVAKPPKDEWTNLGVRETRYRIAGCERGDFTFGVKSMRV